jgi:hypothetical protein
MSEQEKKELSAFFNEKLGYRIVGDERTEIALYWAVQELLKKMVVEREEARVKNMENIQEELYKTISVIGKQRDNMTFERYDLASQLKSIPLPKFWIESEDSTKNKYCDNFMSIKLALNKIIYQLEHVVEV